MLKLGPSIVSSSTTFGLLLPQILMFSWLTCLGKWKLVSSLSGVPKNFVWGGFNKFSWGQNGGLGVVAL